MIKSEVKNRRTKAIFENITFSKNLVLTILLAIIIALVYIRIKVEKVRLGYDFSSNRIQSQQLGKQNQILEAEFMKLKSPEHLEKLAINLGFKYPTQNDVIYSDFKKAESK